MCKVIAVANQKGGCSKTSVVANLGIGLALTGRKVLLIDSDPQGSLTASLGFPDPDEIPLTLATIMMNIIDEKDFPEDYGMLHHMEGIDLIPANMELSGIEVSLGNTLSCEIRGKKVQLFYEVSQHDEGEGFTIHSDGRDIWDWMPEPELRKLEREDFFLF